MKILVTGISGFAGSNIAINMRKTEPNNKIIGFDNLSRQGCERNIEILRSTGIEIIRGDIRSQSDIETLPAVDWIIDCAANPSVLAGLNGQSSSRQVMEHNLLGTINLLEYCKKHKAGLILLSTSSIFCIGTCGFTC